MSEIPVIDLALAPGQRAAWDQPRWKVYLWSVTELLLVTSPWQVSSRLRVGVLRIFGAEIGRSVVFRPRTRVRFPWKLHIGDRSWIGEGVWFHNQDHIYIGHDVVVSQDTMMTTGSHRHRKDMALVTRPIRVENGAWVTARCLVLGGSVIGNSALIRPMSLIAGEHIPANEIWGGNPLRFYDTRFGGRVE